MSTKEKREVSVKSESAKRASSLSAASVFGESFADRSRRIRKKSPFGSLATWKLIQVIVKEGCDLRQEQFASQLISQFEQIFQLHKVAVWLKPYEIICTGPNSGLIQTVVDTISLDSLNKKLKALGIGSLNGFFKAYYTNPLGTSCILA